VVVVTVALLLRWLLFHIQMADFHLSSLVRVILCCAAALHSFTISLRQQMVEMGIKV
jgi:hypothetical protein